MNENKTEYNFEAPKNKPKKFVRKPNHSRPILYCNKENNNQWVNRQLRPFSRQRKNEA